MFSVVTARYLNDGKGRRRIVSRGPLHLNEQHANRWAEYLRQAGHFQEVRVASSGTAKGSEDLAEFLG